MHQPALGADKEGVCLGHGEIVHYLGLTLHRNELDHAVRAISFADVSTHPQVARVDPAAFERVEGVLGRGLQQFAVEEQMHLRGVGVHHHIGDGEQPIRAGTLVIRPDPVTNHDLADGTQPVFGADQGLGAEAVEAQVIDHLDRIDLVDLIADTRSGAGVVGAVDQFEGLAEVVGLVETFDRANTRRPGGAIAPSWQRQSKDIQPQDGAFLRERGTGVQHRLRGFIGVIDLQGNFGNRPHRQQYRDDRNLAAGVGRTA
ncbi:MAG: hypothetical protein GFH27_549301n154 [Chloroflexi bacterium AL-W]|nr:hypothetical protein [Chloroflexi bacterium AL-N1]NOK68347.1 hypothetical protein [Chloroflexi bacterium AL-N10]NOK73993.1 hypothetical protein [Chloroflexi bacterium AL-N5]NOK82961.1 hypothetical protein [Chloroflexi bacterium AL-W]NOK90483.1 hypothetical protein [Chloroflexi bacterium AL-N15]